MRSVIVTKKTNRIDYVGKKAVFIGHSITAGTGASDDAHRYTSLFCASKGCIEVNIAIGGQVLQDGDVWGRTVFDKTTVPQYSADEYSIMMIDLMVNDIGVNNGTMRPDGFGSTLTDVIDYAVLTQGWPSNLIVILSPSYVPPIGYNGFIGTCGVSIGATSKRVNSYISIGAKTAYTKNCRWVNVFSAMVNAPNRNELTAGDNLHLNNTGHAFEASTIENALP